MARIVLVEDNPHNQAVFVAVLQRRGHDVTLAEDGERALAVIPDLGPDLVLLDLSIPKVDGWTVARRLRAHASVTVAGVPILALTAHAMRGDRDRALEAGCNGYLSKPVSPRELDRVVQEMLSARRAA
jgi:CheY-like chemotaxis protein